MASAMWLILIFVVVLVTGKSKFKPDDFTDQFLAEIVNNALKSPPKGMVVTLADHKAFRLFLNYASYKTEVEARLYTSIVTTMIILGAATNALLRYLFYMRKVASNNEMEQLFLKKYDFVIFLDIFVCLIILPYTIVYENRIITDKYTCKILEFLRHVITLESHLILLPFISLLAKRKMDKNEEAQLNRVLYCITLVSIVLSVPSLAVFSCGQRKELLDKYFQLNTTNIIRPEDILVVNPYANITRENRLDVLRVLFEPNYCHLTTYFEEGNGYLLSNTQEIQMYYGIFGFLYLSSWMFVIKKIIDNILNDDLDDMPHFKRSIEIHMFGKAMGIEHLEIESVGKKKFRYAKELKTRFRNQDRRDQTGSRFRKCFFAYVILNLVIIGLACILYMAIFKVSLVVSLIYSKTVFACFYFSTCCTMSQGIFIRRNPTIVKVRRISSYFLGRNSSSRSKNDSSGKSPLDQSPPDQTSISETANSTPRHSPPDRSSSVDSRKTDTSMITESESLFPSESTV